MDERSLPAAMQVQVPRTPAPRGHARPDLFPSESANDVIGSNQIRVVLFNGCAESGTFFLEGVTTR